MLWWLDVSNMASRNLAELTKFCKDRGGGTLRIAFTYTEDGGEVLYAREDIEEIHRHDGFEPLRRAAWNVHETVLAETPHIETMGDYRVTVHTFDDAFVMQFRESPEEGVAVSFDREIGRNLHEFLLECEEYLR